jgi:hypothetical protein
LDCPNIDEFREPLFISQRVHDGVVYVFQVVVLAILHEFKLILWDFIIAEYIIPLVLNVYGL